jgi:NADPH:quinone reductase-like Zn-dependent oxidoreductase
MAAMAINAFARQVPRRSFVALATSDNVSKLGADDVAIKMMAAPITGSDNMNGAGVVTSVGSGVKNLSVNDVVFSKNSLGKFREVVKVSSKKLLKVTSDIPAEYAGIIDAPCAAEQLLKGVNAGDVVVQSGADSLVGQSLIQLARSRGITTINIVKSSTDETEMVDLLTNLGGDIVCQPHYAVSHRFKTLISDMKAPVLAIHYADNLDDPAVVSSLGKDAKISDLRNVAESASSGDLLKIKVSSVLNRLAPKSVSYGPSSKDKNSFQLDQATVDSICDKIKNEELYLWVENFPVEDLAYASEKANEVAPGFRAPVLKFA